MAGYSTNPLVKKLGYKAGENVFITTKTSTGFRGQLRAEHVILAPVLPAYWAHGFFTGRADILKFLEEIDFDQIKNGLWVSWPKKSSGVKTDLTEQTFRDLILPTGWVDIKVVAIDDTWSGLKFVRRKA